MSNLCEAGHNSHNIIRVPTIQGDMWVYDNDRYKNYKGYCTGQDDVSQTLKNVQVWEKEETDLIKSILEAGDKTHSFIDVGAHVGWYSLLASKLGYPIAAFEAEGESCELIKANININKLPPISIFNMWIDENSKLVALIKDIELIKIDIEGNEQYAIKLFEKVIERGGVKHIVMEVSPTFNDSYPALVQKLVDYGYYVYELDMKPFDFKYDFDQTNLLFVRQS